jgi:hypothetical protein
MVMQIPYRRSKGVDGSNGSRKCVTVRFIQSEEFKNPRRVCLDWATLLDLMVAVTHELLAFATQLAKTGKNPFER